jgi:hypothetical protein
MELTPSYLLEAFKEPLNLAGLGLAGILTLAAATGDSSLPVTLLLGGSLVVEGIYLTVASTTTPYRRLVDRRRRQRLQEARQQNRLALIRTFDPREREAVEYLSWMKTQIGNNYRKVTRIEGDPPQLRQLEVAWESFIDLLDEYRRRKQHLRTTNRQAVENQLRQAERTARLAEPETRALHEKNTDLLRRRLGTFDEIERSVKRVEAQLQMIENFFGLVNDQVVTMPTPDHLDAIDFETLLSSIETTREILRQTAPVMGQLDTLTRQADSW